MAALPLMGAGGSIVGLDFDDRQAWPAYDWMGVAKAALESVTRYLARDLGPAGDPGEPGRGRAGADHGGQVASPASPQFEDAWDGRAPLGWDLTDPAPVAKTVCALLSRLVPGHHRRRWCGRRRVPRARCLTLRRCRAGGHALAGVESERARSRPTCRARVDALLLLSFGGPEGPDEVRPFLENVTRGPRRAAASGWTRSREHYRHFGGVSPLNAQQPGR